MTSHRIGPGIWGGAYAVMAVTAAVLAGSAVRAAEMPIEYIDTSFENASPLWWEPDANGAVHIYTIYEHERASVNRASLHWHFAVEAEEGSDVTLVLHNFINYWNGKRGSAIKDSTISVVSSDGKAWKALVGERLDENSLMHKLHMDGPKMYVARVEPYRISDLENLKKAVAGTRLAGIETIGRTVQGRELEMIRIGRADAGKSVLLRARAHPWESGGNWVVQGLIKRLLADDENSRKFLDRYCVYVMPMANKDGVARGGSRFNMLGMDLNRKWDKPADRDLSPENNALEKWIESMIAGGKKPDLAIDLHNDSGGNLHISRPNIDLEAYLAKMKRFEQLLRKYTWFTEGSTGGTFRNPGTLGEGMLERYGITACILELNANWIAGLKDYPSGAGWELFGEHLCEVFYDYFE